jgi:hypothetical protein
MEGFFYHLHAGLVLTAREPGLTMGPLWRLAARVDLKGGI